MPATSTPKFRRRWYSCPARNGISHNELEDATQTDCAAGTNVLMHTVLALAGVAS